MRVRALITEPTQGTEIDRGDITVRGVAWSGVAPIERVEVNARSRFLSLGTSTICWKIRTRHFWN